VSDLHTATPGSPGVQRDVQRVRELLRDHVPLHPSDGILESLRDRHLAATTLGALRRRRDALDDVRSLSRQSRARTVQD
jgi:hypothetical protein